MILGADSRFKIGKNGTDCMIMCQFCLNIFNDLARFAKKVLSLKRIFPIKCQLRGVELFNYIAI